MDKEEIKKIANLARLEINEEESEKMAGQIDSILHYVDQISAADVEDDGSRVENASVRNVLREDTEPHESNHTEDLLEEAPGTKDGFIKVKKIL